MLRCVEASKPPRHWTSAQHATCATPIRGRGSVLRSRFQRRVSGQVSGQAWGAGGCRSGGYRRSPNAATFQVTGYSRKREVVSGLDRAARQRTTERAPPVRTSSRVPRLDICEWFPSRFPARRGEAAPEPAASRMHIGSQHRHARLRQLQVSRLQVAGGLHPCNPATSSARARRAPKPLPAPIAGNPGLTASGAGGSVCRLFHGSRVKVGVAAVIRSG